MWGLLLLSSLLEALRGGSLVSTPINDASDEAPNAPHSTVWRCRGSSGFAAAYSALRGIRRGQSSLLERSEKEVFRMWGR